MDPQSIVCMDWGFMASHPSDYYSNLFHLFRLGVKKRHGKKLRISLRKKLKRNAFDSWRKKNGRRS